MKKIIACLLTICLFTAFSFPHHSQAEATESVMKMDDPALLPYLEDTLYASLVESLNSDEYYVQNVRAIYISQDYLDEVAYNTRANIYFGYTLAELNELFDGQRYIFTLGEDNKTTVEAWTDYVDPYKQVIKNIAIGTGVILICVTVTMLSAGAGAPACTMIFATAAQYGISGAIVGAYYGSITAGAIKLIETGNPNQAFEAAVIQGSESFKWGAIIGAVSGGLTETVGLVGATLNGLTMNEAAFIQMETGYPLNVIKEFHSFAEYEVYRDSGLLPHVIDGKMALVRQIDITKEDAYGRTNLERMLHGDPPLDPDGVAYELHHVGQKNDSIFAVLTQSEHRGEGNFRILHEALKGSEVDHGSAFEAAKRAFWNDYADQIIQAIEGV